LHAERRLGGAKQCLHLDGKASGLSLVRFFKGRNCRRQEAFSGSAVCLHTRLSQVYISALNMLWRADSEGFGSCRNHFECEAACPKEIPRRVMAESYRDFTAASFTRDE